MEDHGTVYDTRTLKMREQIEAMKEIWTKDVANARRLSCARCGLATSAATRQAQPMTSEPMSLGRHSSLARSTRFVPDSPVEGAGFEPSVPGKEGSTITKCSTNFAEQACWRADAGPRRRRDVRHQVSNGTSLFLQLTTL